MSAFLLVINRRQQAIDVSIAEQMFAQLDHFGVDGRDLIVRDHFAIGHQHFWTVSEEQGEHQPLHDAQSDSWLVFHGRIDNRAQLIAELGLLNGESVSDAYLLLYYLLAFSDTRLKNVVGPFVFVHYKPQSHEVLAARDSMGGRYLVFHLTPEFLVITTHELAISAHPQVGLRLNEEKRIRTLFHLLENQPSSLLEGATVLHPGQKLEVKSDQHSLRTYYLPPPKARLCLPDDEAYALRFRQLLTQAVRRRMRSISPVGVMLSGGLDSVPITIAASELAGQGNQRLSAFSWVFDKFPDDDERAYSSDLCRRLGIKQNCINCDDIWPRFDPRTYVNPAIPYTSPFSAFNQELFGRAQSQGVKTILSGIGGDLLYTDTAGALLELLRQGRWADIRQEIKYLRSLSLSVFGIIKYHLIAPLPVVRNYLAIRRSRAPVENPLMTKRAQRLLKTPAHWLHNRLKAARRPQQYLNLVDAYEGEDAHQGKHMEVKFGLERRYPLRDRDLVEFMLSVPVEQLRLASEMRPIVKNAFAESMGVTIGERNSKTEFRSVMAAGIKNDLNYRQWLTRPGSVWQRDVKECDFNRIAADQLGISELEWRCAYYEYWRFLCYNPLEKVLGQNHEKTQYTNKEQSGG